MASIDQIIKDLEEIRDTGGARPSGSTTASRRQAALAAKEALNNSRELNKGTKQRIELEIRALRIAQNQYKLDEKEYKVINEYIDSINKELFNNKIVTEIKPLNNFYEAEKYHQNYYKNNSSAGYCRAVITPKVLKAKKELNKFYK